MGELTGKLKKIEKEGRDCIRRARGHMENNSGDWDTNKRLMLGKVSDTSGYSLAEAYGHFRSLTSHILNSVPMPFFEGKKEEQRQIAGMLSDAVWYDFQIANLRDRFVKALWQNFPYGFGAIAEQLETTFRYDKKGEVSGIKDQRFFWKNIPPRDIIFDPDGFCIDLSDHRYIGIAYYKTISELRSARNNQGEKAYFNLEKVEKLPAANEATRSAKGQMSQSSGSLFNRNDKPNDNPEYKQIKIWRLYDRTDETISDYTDVGQKLIRREDWPLPISIQGILQFPVQLLAMNTEADDFYPIPECTLIRSQMTGLIALNDQMMADLAAKIRKYICLSPYVNKETAGKMMNTKRPNEFFLTSNIDQLATVAGVAKVDSAKDVVSKVEEIQFDPQTFPAMAQIREQIQNITAYGAANRGGLPQIRNAKEAARVADQMQKALLSRQSSLEEVTRRVAIYHALLIKAAVPSDSDRYFRITDKAGALKTWLKYNPSEIPDEKDLFCDVYVGSSTPQTLDTKRAQFMQEMNVMLPVILQLGMSPMPLLYRYAEIFQVKYFDSFFKNPKGKAMELLAALAEAGKKGGKMSPETLLKAQMELIDANLNPNEKAAVLEAVHSEGKEGGGGGAPEGGGMNKMASADPIKAAGNAEGMIS